MSRPIVRSLVALFVLVLIGSAYALRADAPPVMPAVFIGKFALIQPENGGWIAMNHPEARTVGIQSFIVGRVTENSPAGPPSEYAGSRIWIPAEDFKRLWEFDNAEQYLKAGERYQTESKKYFKNRGEPESP
jgi:hypothetical protein